MIVDQGLIQLSQRPADPQAELILEIGIRAGRREPDQLRDNRLGRRGSQGRLALVQLPAVLGE